MPIERKLAAIMFTDIAGYTKSMSKSESQTLNLLEKKLFLYFLNKFCGVSLSLGPERNTPFLVEFLVGVIIMASTNLYKHTQK